MSNLSLGLCGTDLPKALVEVHLLPWIATYPLDKVIRSLNDQGLMFKCNTEKSCILLNFFTDVLNVSSW